MKAIEKLRLRLSRLALGDPPIYRIVLSRVEMRLLRGAIATPSPTIAADDGECDECERKELQISAMLQAAYRAQLDGNPLGASQAVIEAYRHANDEDDEDCVWCRSDNVDNLRKRIADLEAPTIAAPSPQDGHAEGCGFADEVAADWCPCRGPGSRWPKTEPSPSNEVTPEMVEAALEAFVESENVPDTRHDTEAMHDAIEAALKARKPADDGAGQ